MQEKEFERKFIVIDTETTGLDLDTDEILQLSIIDASGSVLYNSYFRPTKVTSWPDAQCIHGITPEMVSHSPTIDDERTKIQTIISAAEVIVGYNVIFDFNFLRTSGFDFEHLFEENYGWHIIDLMELFAPIYGDWHPWYNSYTWKKLSVAANHYNYDWGADAAHDALADCRAALHIWTEMVKRGDIQKAEQMLTQ